MFGHTTSLPTSSSSNYIVKCNVNPKPMTTSTSSTTLTPRVKVTVQQPSITTLPSRTDSSSENISSSSSSTTTHTTYLKTPTSNTLSIMTTSSASSGPEYSYSAASSVDDSDELASYDQYLSPHGRQSNPSPELRKKTLDDWTKTDQRHLPRSKSEINTAPMEQSQQQTATSQIKPVS